MLVTELEYSRMYMEAFNDGFKQGSEVEREKILKAINELIDSDYNTKEFQLFKGDLKEMLKSRNEVQIEMERGKRNDCI